MLYFTKQSTESSDWSLLIRQRSGLACWNRLPAAACCRNSEMLLNSQYHHIIKIRFSTWVISSSRHSVLFSAIVNALTLLPRKALQEADLVHWWFVQKKLTKFGTYHKKILTVSKRLFLLLVAIAFCIPQQLSTCNEPIVPWKQHQNRELSTFLTAPLCFPALSFPFVR